MFLLIICFRYWRCLYGILISNGIIGKFLRLKPVSLRICLIVSADGLYSSFVIAKYQIRTFCVLSFIYQTVRNANGQCQFFACLMYRLCFSTDSVDNQVFENTDIQIPVSYTLLDVYKRQYGRRSFMGNSFLPVYDLCCHVHRSWSL